MVSAPASECRSVMPRQSRHIFAGIAWVIASLVVWVMLWESLIRTLMYLRMTRVPEPVGITLMVIQFGGMVVVPIGFAVLAKRGILPLTRASNRRGFAVQPRRADAA